MSDAAEPVAAVVSVPALVVEAAEVSAVVVTGGFVAGLVLPLLPHAARTAAIIALATSR